MPQHQSAIKRVRQNEVRRLRNNQKRSKLRTLYKKAMSATTKDEAEKSYKDAIAYIDRLSVKGILHKNTAARKKSALTRHFNSVQ
jgi:small subunit ribosomal protein S20